LPLQYGVQYAMLDRMAKGRDRNEVLFEKLLALGSTGESSEATTTTSIRLPVDVREALDAAVALGLERTLTDATVEALRDRLIAHAQLLALEDHYADHPHLRPSLARLAIATADLDGNELAQRTELIERAAAELVVHRPDATPDDVLTYALALAAGSDAA
jgi:hypothetical protein